MSSFPIESSYNLDLSLTSLERRGLLGVHTRDFDVYTTHLNLLGHHRFEQMESICAYIKNRTPANKPLILAGDFNDWSHEVGPLLSASLGVVDAYSQMNGSPARTFPSWLPLLKLDRLYIRGFQLRSAEVLQGTRWARLSDHLPLVATVTL